MTGIAFTVYGSPVAQPRTKASVIRTQSGKTFAHVYEPGGAARQWKSDIKHEAIKHKPSMLIQGPITMHLKFYLLRPQRLCGPKMSALAMPSFSKPDVDNLYKAIADCLEGIIYKNDSQINFTTILKMYHEKDKGPRVEVRIEDFIVSPDDGRIKRVPREP